MIGEIGHMIKKTAHQRVQLAINGSEKAKRAARTATSNEYERPSRVLTRPTGVTLIHWGAAPLASSAATGPAMTP